MDQSQITWDKIIDNPIMFGVAYKKNPSLGFLVYEYNPFYNYRVSKTHYMYKNRLFTVQELLSELKIVSDAEELEDELAEQVLSNKLQENNNDWALLNVPPTETDPILIEKNLLTNFETDQFNFSLNNPVQMLPLPSYDGSVNLILNDGLNSPKLINSRFSPLGRNLYKVVDRKGDLDTNIYDLGDQFDLDTSLYKKTIEIPKLSFLGVSQGGQMKVGNYHFYFTYVDADGNETDIVAESGLVSLFIGIIPSAIRAGFRNENCHKLVKFTLSNIDTAYPYVLVYYTKSTSDINESAAVSTYKINEKYIVNSELSSNITVTGYESVTEIDVSQINNKYQIVDNAQTQESCLNRLFLGNIQKPDLLYEDLKDISLRFLPYLNKKNFNSISDIGITYDATLLGYYDPYNIYKYVGYEDEEIYRFGIVFILSNNTLTPVFNIRGLNKLGVTDPSYTDVDLWDTKKENRKYISIKEDTNLILASEESINSLVDLENSEGVVRIKDLESNNSQQIYGITIKVKKEVLEYLKNNLHIQGFFFVRLKRMPLRLCLAYTIGVDNVSEKASNTPVLPISSTLYRAESFLNSSNRYLDQEKAARLRTLSKENVLAHAAICPEYDLNQPFFNSLFTGESYKVRQSKLNSSSEYLSVGNGNKHYYTELNKYESSSENFKTCRIIGVEDNTKLVSINNGGDEELFSARAGEAEEVYRVSYLEYENKSETATNLVRGSYGPFLGITPWYNQGRMIDIFISGYLEGDMENYFKIRYNDKSSYYAISDRFVLSELLSENNNYVSESSSNGIIVETFKNPLYRGDTYICQCTHRLNRNFQDPSAPINDDIVDETTWVDNYKFDDSILNLTKAEKINLGDVNAVRLGMWVTLLVRSSHNLNIRGLDTSLPDEEALTGHPRGFYPYYGMATSGPFKTPEAFVINNGLDKSLSERYNFEVPDVPYIKNEFSNRIMYSDIAVTDAFQNGFRVFRETNYKDYTKQYGSITKLIELDGDLICIFEHGVGVITVNERTLSGEGDGGPVYVNTHNILPETPNMLSDSYGSQWIESVIKTPKYIYGVDTVGRKIWRCTKSNFEIISDFKVLKFLNDSISLTERELTPIVGIRNVKTHYNAYKGDVMFTFYDNLYGFEEKVWNLCFNEWLGLWITFYSWVPSYSENIYNQYFSFDRTTSKWIAKIGTSHHGNDFSDGATLSDNIITKDWESDLTISLFYVDNRDTNNADTTESTFTLERDNYLNYKNFKIYVNDKKSYLTLEEGVLYVNLCSELYERVGYEMDHSGNFTTTQHIYFTEEDAGKRSYCRDLAESEWEDIWDEDTIASWTDHPELAPTNNSSGYIGRMYSYEGVLYYIVRDESSEEIAFYLEEANYYESTQTWSESYLRPWKAMVESNQYWAIHKVGGKRMMLDEKYKINPDLIVYLLNIDVSLLLKINAETELQEAIITGASDVKLVDQGYFESVIAVIPEYNKQYLTTDFWKHGRAGIVDIADKIYPTYWYGKQHPFEFEFIVRDNPDKHKIFDNLEIISNNAEPESFHYEIVGDCYDFADDKKNMYIRLEATKKLYQYNGVDVAYDHNYTDLEEEHRPIEGTSYYDKSTILPLWYARLDKINEIEDYYNLKDGSTAFKNFSAKAGGEIVKYDDLLEYHIWNHSKAVDIKENGRLRGNMLYKEDKWYVLINSLNIVLKNETTWTNGKVPIELGQSPLPKTILEQGSIEVPSDLSNRDIVNWNWATTNTPQTRHSEAKLKDKWVKIRVRYKGDKLAIISAIKTLYSISYA